MNKSLLSGFQRLVPLPKGLTVLKETQMRLQQQSLDEHFAEMNHHHSPVKLVVIKSNVFIVGFHETVTVIILCIHSLYKLH